MTILSPEEAAAYLRISRTLLSQETNRGKIPHRRLGDKKVLYVQEVLDQWLMGNDAHGSQAHDPSCSSGGRLPDFSYSQKEE